MPAHECLATKDVRDALAHAITLLEVRRDALLGYAHQIADTHAGALIVEGAGQAEASAAVLRRLVEPAIRPT